jgi:hypothetical protein
MLSCPWMDRFGAIFSRQMPTPRDGTCNGGEGPLWHGSMSPVVYGMGA